MKTDYKNSTSIAIAFYPYFPGSIVPEGQNVV